MVKDTNPRAVIIFISKQYYATKPKARMSLQPAVAFRSYESTPWPCVTTTFRQDFLTANNFPLIKTSLSDRSCIYSLRKESERTRSGRWPNNHN